MTWKESINLGSPIEKRHALFVGVWYGVDLPVAVLVVNLEGLLDV